MSWPANSSQYISSVKYAAVTAWAAATAKAVGDRVRQNATPSVNNERVFICIVAGTTHATTEPTWNLTRGVKTTDNTVTWMECTGSAAMNGDDDNTPTWLDNKNINTDLGQIIKDNAGTHYFICTTAGQTGNGAEPTWNVAAVGNTTTDNAATWTYIGLAPSAFGNWSAPHPRIMNAQATNWGTNGGAAINPTKYWVGSDHAETQGTNMNWTARGSQAAPIDIVTVDVAGSVPPVSADVKTTPTSSITTTAGNGMTFGGIIRVCSGISFFCGTTSNVTLSFANDSGADKNFENCSFALGVGAGSGASFGFGRSMGRTRIKNGVFKFSNVGQGFQNGGQVDFENCSIDAAGSAPSLFIQATVSGSDFVFTACDLSHLSGSTIGNNNSNAQTSRYNFNDCKFPSSYTLWSFSGSDAGNLDQITLSRCSNGAAPLQMRFGERAGDTQSTLTVYRHDGAKENSVPFGWKIDTTANCNNGNASHNPPAMGKFNTVTGTNINVNVYGVYNGAALPKDNEIWLEVEYLGVSGNTQGVFKDNKAVNYIIAGTNHAADSASDWDDGVTARANSTAYVVGDVRKVASNPGRIFICTTAGTSAGSEPGGYASAVDGGSVTDNTAVFRAGMRFSMTVTLTSPQVQQAGMLYGKVKVGKLSSGYYLDPELELT